MELALQHQSLYNRCTSLSVINYIFSKSIDCFSLDIWYSVHVQRAKHVVTLHFCLSEINPHDILPKWIIKRRDNWLTVMVNFMYHFDRAMKWPDIWFNIILGISERAFEDEINIWVSRLSKADCLPNVHGPHQIWGLNRTKRQTLHWVRGNYCCQTDELGHFFPAFFISGVLFQPLNWNLQHGS